MAEKKRKTRDDINQRKSKPEKKRKQFQSKNVALGRNKKKKNKDEQKRSGPRLPSALRRELEVLKPNPRNSDEEIDSDEEEGLHAMDVYEYDEPMPEEESRKNRRFDPVDNLEYELPEEFEDENVQSDDDDDVDNDDGGSERNNRRDNSDQSGDEVEGEDEGRHVRMLQGITGMPAEAFEGKKIKKNIVVSEAYPESEYNPSRDALDGNGRINIQDLLGPLHGKPGYSKLRNRMQQLERKSRSVQAPLTKVEQEKVERKAAYDETKKDISKWESLVKMNREAPTISFVKDTNVGFSTVGAIASEFKPRTDFEKKIASVLQDAEVVEAHKMDGARLLELNKISVEDVKDRQNRLAKMRSLLFRHEMKAKHIKKIKSKTFHRLLKKDRLKASSAEMQMDPESAKELAIKQEFKRAEERMRLKYKNNSKWAKRIMKRGLAAQDEGTRAAISEQLHQHALLTRKMNSMKDNSSSDDSSDEDEDEDEDEDLPPVTDQDGTFKLVTKAKEKTLKALEEEDDMPKSGLLSLPFMVRGLKKSKEAADEEAKLALEEYESSLRQLEDMNGAESPKKATSSGRRVFGAAKKQSDDLSNKIKSNSIGRDSGSEDELSIKEDGDVGSDRNVVSQKDVHIDPVILHEGSDIGQEPLFKSFDDIVGDPGPKTTYDVAIFASNSWKKMKSENEIGITNRKNSRVVDPALPHKGLKEGDEDSGSESGEDMVDGILSSGAKADYTLPSQADLIHRAFAGDDVEEEFEKDKLEVLNEENPEPEKPVLIPGWGQWTHIQKKKGLPSWMLEEHENAKKKREDALKKRKDSHLKHVIISERLDKKTAGLHTKTLPFPFKDEHVFEQSIRKPIGPESNPAATVAALTRPEADKRLIETKLLLVELIFKEEQLRSAQMNDQLLVIKIVQQMPSGRGCCAFKYLQ
ncbi:Small-subunit processome [Macleaya cordata]|uniref:Small-subunit processome n=1 Tax=Macleaya cordata TaxID=56857 RepID=A0A200QQJ5_MACCD|nr:Small-subunit processome [Macleaya cordata]